MYVSLVSLVKLSTISCRLSAARINSWSKQQSCPKSWNSITFSLTHEFFPLFFNITDGDGSHLRCGPPLCSSPARSGPLAEHWHEAALLWWVGHLATRELPRQLHETGELASCIEHARNDFAIWARLPLHRFPRTLLQTQTVMCSVFGYLIYVSNEICTFRNRVI